MTFSCPRWHSGSRHLPATSVLQYLHPPPLFLSSKLKSVWELFFFFFFPEAWLVQKQETDGWLFLEGYYRVSSSNKVFFHRILVSFNACVGNFIKLGPRTRKWPMTMRLQKKDFRGIWHYYTESLPGGSPLTWTNTLPPPRLRGGRAFSICLPDLCHSNGSHNYCVSSQVTQRILAAL